MDFVVKEKTGIAIQEAVDAAYGCGGGRVVLEPGDYECVSIVLKSHVELHIPAGARIMASPNVEDYPDIVPRGLENVRPEKSQKCVISCAEAEGVSITGQGEINGRGPAFHDQNSTLYGTFWGRKPIPRPRMIQFFNCKNVTLDGITLRDAPSWTCWFTHCQDLNISRIRVLGNPKMINNDGLDIDACNRVTVTDSFFDTGDDCIAIRAIRLSPEDTAICENVFVSNCRLCTSCNCIRIGCPNDDTIHNIIFSGLVIHGRGNGILCEAPPQYLRKGEHGYMDVHNIQFTDCDIDCPWRAITVCVARGIRLRGVHDFAFRNMNVRSGGNLLFQGNVNTVLENITLENIQGLVLSKQAIDATYVRNFRVNNVCLTAEVGEEEPLSEAAGSSWEKAE